MLEVLSVNDLGSEMMKHGGQAACLQQTLKGCFGSML